MNLTHSPKAKISPGPSAFLLSRTAINPGKLTATSTQSAPLPLKLLLCHVLLDSLCSFTGPVSRLG